MSEIRRVRQHNSTLYRNFDPDAKPKACKPVNQKSEKQKVRDRKLSAMKKAWIDEQFRLYGFAACQGGCERQIHDRKDAPLFLDGHHTQKRQDVAELMLYVCRSCHRRIHLGNGV